MAVSAKLRRKANAAARALRKEAREARKQHALQSLHDASVRNGRAVLSIARQSVPVSQVRNLDGDADAGPGMTARLKAFLSLRGFEPSGIKRAQALSTRTHRDRRLLAVSTASTRRQPVQQPTLRTVPPARAKAAPQAPELQTVRRPPTEPFASRLLRRSRFKAPPVTLLSSGIDTLRHELGLLNQGCRLQDAVYVAIDTEGSSDVTEVGISTLDTRDIQGITPDHRAANWISKIKHQHIVIRRGSSTSHISNRTRTTLFCTSEMDTPENARALILSTLRLARQTSPGHAPRKVHLVGQSIANDVTLMKRGALRLDLSHSPLANFTFDNLYDTAMIALVARTKGAPFESMQLGHLARTLEVDSKYWLGSSVRGTHNSSNDAAYTMMVMLLFAVRWERLAKELPQPPPTPPLHQLKVGASPGGLSKREIENKRVNRSLEDKAMKEKAQRRATTAAKIASEEETYRQAWQQAGVLEKASMTIKRARAKLARLFWGGNR